MVFLFQGNCELSQFVLKISRDAVSMIRKIRSLLSGRIYKTINNFRTPAFFSEMQYLTSLSIWHFLHLVPDNDMLKLLKGETFLISIHFMHSCIAPSYLSSLHEGWQPYQVLICQTPWILELAIWIRSKEQCVKTQYSFFKFCFLIFPRKWLVEMLFWNWYNTVLSFDEIYEAKYWNKSLNFIMLLKYYSWPLNKKFKKLTYGKRHYVILFTTWNSSYFLQSLFSHISKEVQF